MEQTTKNRYDTLMDSLAYFATLTGKMNDGTALLIERVAYVASRVTVIKHLDAFLKVATPAELELYAKGEITIEDLKQLRADLKKAPVMA